MSRHAHASFAEQGLTLLETLIALVLLAVVTTALTPLLAAATRAASSTTASDRLLDLAGATDTLLTEHLDELVALQPGSHLTFGWPDGTDRHEIRAERLEVDALIKAETKDETDPVWINFTSGRLSVIRRIPIIAGASDVDGGAE